MTAARDQESVNPADFRSGPFDIRISRSAVGLLADFNAAGLLDAADVQVAARLGQLAGERDENVLLAVALAVRAVRQESVCVSLAEASALNPTLPWPEAEAWSAAVARSVLTGQGRPLRVENDLLYLDRYWRQETQVCADLLARDRRPTGPVDIPRLRDDLARLFPEGDSTQQLAAVVAVHRSTTVLSGGPGTGKTTTVARLLAVLNAQAGRTQRIALAAPTGKAANRLAESVRRVVTTLPVPDQRGLTGLEATTVHRLLGSLPGNATRFRHHRADQLPYEIIVIDEASMLSLALMANLLDAVRPDAKFILVGDPDQLASVEAGSVLADLVDGLTARRDHPASSPFGEAVGQVVPPATLPQSPGWRHGIVLLQRNWRFHGGIAKLAAGIRDGDPDAAMDVLLAGGSDLSLGAAGVEDDVAAAAVSLREAAESGDVGAALDRLGRHRVLCAHWSGPAGVRGWDRQIVRWLAERTGVVRDGEWYVGRPLLVTANDHVLGLNNGDTGVVMAESDGSMIAVFPRGDSVVRVRPSRLADVLTVHAMTVHRSQGSQFERVTVVLPPLDSPLLTREMFYTAVSRAQQHVRLIGTEEQVRAAISRPAVRASGLRVRLRDG